MRKMDETGLRLCKMQGDVFVSSVNAMNCSSPVFLRRFMYSQVAQRMDTGGFLFEACDVSRIFEEINAEFGESSYGKEKYSEAEMYWIGYVYRYWAYTYQKTSRQIYKLMKPKEMRSLYFPYHSLDPSQAIERILEAKGVNEENQTERGVRILRTLIQKEKAGTA